MTDANAAAPAGPSGEASADSSWKGLAALREAHLNLRRALSSAAEQLGPGGREQQIRAFLVSASKAGAFVADAKERRVAQGILDYWSAELATSPQAQGSDFTSVLLAPFDATRTAPESDQPAQGNDDPRTLIRLSALARQWRDSGKQAGYLLTDETIAQAARFADRNPDLAELVEQSQRADRARRRRKRNARNIVLAVLAFVAVIAGLLTWQFVALPKTGERLVQQVRESTSPEVQQSKLWWLMIAQPWLPPYDFSGTQKISNVTLPKFRLWAPNFTKVAFGNVKFPNARLPAASFSTSILYADDPNDKNDFSGADLTFSQYLGSEIYATSFADADLYRAAFDRAMLCDVDFTRADLRNTSFFAASLDDKTYASLRKTVWWVAAGWNSGHLEKLLDSPEPNHPNPAVTHSSASAADIQAARQALRRSAHFCKDIAGPIADAAPGTFEQAEALNNMAWTLATWGIDRDSPPAGDYCHVKGLPNDALAAADQAIAVILDLQNKGRTKLDYAYHLSNYRDSKAYILMQANQMQEAKALYEIDLEQTTADSGRLFRYAIALFGTGHENEAETTFQEALDRQYQPRDELQNLKRYIPLPARQMAYKIIDDIYPTPKGIQLCPGPPEPSQKAN